MIAACWRANASAPVSSAIRSHDGLQCAIAVPRCGHEPREQQLRDAVEAAGAGHLDLPLALLGLLGRIGTRCRVEQRELRDALGRLAL